MNIPGYLIQNVTKVITALIMSLGSYSKQATIAQHWIAAKTKKMLLIAMETTLDTRNQDCMNILIIISSAQE